MSPATWRRGTVGVALAIAALSLPAAADTYPGTGGYLRDGRNHTFWLGSSAGLTIAASARDKMANLQNQTNMTRQETACDSTTDIRFEAINLNGLRGKFTCESVGSRGVCFRGRIEINLNEINIGGDDAWDLAKTTCHEIGHGIGFAHLSTETDCMITGEIPAAIAQWTTYRTHHVDHVDERYP